MKSQKFDCIVIGAGQGASLALALAQAGKKTALIEKNHVGGTCVNVGCTPTKTLVASARVAYLARRASDYGVNVGDVSIEMPKVIARKTAIVKDFRDSTQEHLHDPNLTLMYGVAKFTGPKMLQVLADGETTELSAETVIIATGTQPKIPPLDGLDAVEYLTSTSAMELQSVPEKLLILGGGVISVEFAQMFRRLGAQVTMIEKRDQLLGREDADVAQRVREILEADGIEVLCGTSAKSVAQENGAISLQVLAENGATKTLHGSHLLVAVGRETTTTALNVSATGVECDEKGFVKVNDKLESNQSGIYALGDIAGSPPFTHIAYDDFRILCANLVDGKECTTRDRLVTWTMFCDPQLGRVGLSESEAKKQNIAYEIATIEMEDVARPLETSETRGFWKVLIAPDGQILGGAFLCIEGGEIMAVVQMAMLGKLPYQRLRDLPIAHPTLAESLNNLFLKFDREKESGKRRSATGR